MPRNKAPRAMIALVGSTCSAKSVIWDQVARRMRDTSKGWSCCRPRSNDIRKFDEGSLMLAVKDSILPYDGSPETRFRHGREARARQVRGLLEKQNLAGRPVTLVINDAHDCGLGFLLLCKRTWDDLDGYDRLLSVIFVGQPPLARAITACDEIAQRCDILHTPGLGESLEKYLGHDWRVAAVTGGSSTKAPSASSSSSPARITGSAVAITR